MGEINTEMIKNEIISKTKDEVIKALDGILAKKFVSVEDFEKVNALLQKSQAESQTTAINTGHGHFKDFLNLVKKGMTEGTAADGGYLVPPLYSKQIFEVTQNFAKIANLAMHIDVGKTNEFRATSLADDVQVYWVDEGNEIPQTSPKFAQNIVTVKKLAVEIKISNELLADSSVNLDGFLNKIVSRAIAKELDKQLLTGTGAPFVGIVNNPNVTTVVSSASLADVMNEDDLIDVESAVSTDYALDPVYILHRSIWAIIRKKKDNNGRNLGIVDVLTKTIDGIPYILSERAPTNVSASKPILVYGDFSNAIVGHRQDITVQKLTELYAHTGMTAFQFITRFGLYVMAPEAFVILKTAAS